MKLSLAGGAGSGMGPNALTVLPWMAGLVNGFFQVLLSGLNSEGEKMVARLRFQSQNKKAPADVDVVPGQAQAMTYDSPATPKVNERLNFFQGDLPEGSRASK